MYIDFRKTLVGFSLLVSVALLLLATTGRADDGDNLVFTPYNSADVAVDFLHNRFSDGLVVNGTRITLGSAVVHIQSPKGDEAIGPYVELSLNTRLDASTPAAELDALKIGLARILLGGKGGTQCAFDYCEGELELLPFENRALGQYRAGEERYRYNSLALFQMKLKLNTSRDKPVSFHVSMRWRWGMIDDMKKIYYQNEDRILAECPTCHAGGPVWWALLASPDVGGAIGLGIYRYALLQFVGDVEYRQHQDIARYERGHGDELDRRYGFLYENYSKGFRLEVDLNEVLRLQRERFGALSFSSELLWRKTKVHYDGGMYERYNYDPSNFFYSESFVDEQATTLMFGLKWSPRPPKFRSAR